MKDDSTRDDHDDPSDEDDDEDDKDGDAGGGDLFILLSGDDSWYLFEFDGLLRSLHDCVECEG